MCCVVFVGPHRGTLRYTLPWNVDPASGPEIAQQILFPRAADEAAPDACHGSSISAPSRT